jgi:hypothetical protein
MLSKIKHVWSQSDKRGHFIVGAAITQIIGLGDIWIGLIAGLVAGLGKEWWDKYTGRGVYDLVDMYATWAGVVCGFVVLAISCQ